MRFYRKEARSCRKVMEKDPTGKGRRAEEEAAAEEKAVALAPRPAAARAAAAVAVKAEAGVRPATPVRTRNLRTNPDQTERRQRMPGYDGTGPAGGGAMTGGGRGFCNPAGMGYRGGGGRGMRRPMSFGRGMGAGRGWGASPFPAGGASARSMSRDEELAMLKAEAEQLNLSLDTIRKRMAALETPDE